MTLPPVSCKSGNLSFSDKKERRGVPEWTHRVFGGEGEIWTLAPVNPTYTLSRGASSTT